MQKTEILSKLLGTPLLMLNRNPEREELVLDLQEKDALFAGKRMLADTGEVTPTAALLAASLGFLGEVDGRAVVDAKWLPYMEEVPEGSIAVANIGGVMIKSSPFYWSMEDYGKIIQYAAETENIGAIILKIDSPGGMVSGTQTLADIIFNSKKKIYSFIDDGMAASAAYWIGSASQGGVFASHKTSEAGSIGVLTTFYDPTPALEKTGIVVRTIYAPESTEKNLPSREAQKNNDKLIKGELSFIAQEFRAAVEKQRHGKVKAVNGKDPFAGALYFAEEAIALGLIDGIMSFEELVEKITNYELSVTNGESNQLSITNDELRIGEKFSITNYELRVGENGEVNNQKITIKDMGLFRKAALPAVEKLISGVKTGGEVSDEMLEAANAELKAFTGNADIVIGEANDDSAVLETLRNGNVKLRDDLATAQATLATVEGNLTVAQGEAATAKTALTASEEKNAELTAQVATLTDEVTTLGAKDGGSRFEAEQKEDKFDDNALAALDQMEHNRKADSQI